MRREFHVRFCEGGEVRAPSATRLFFGWGDSGTDYDAKVLGQANQALALDPNNSNAYYAKADYLALSHRRSEAVGVTDAGLAVNPNDVTLYTPRTTAENALGHYEQAKADAEKAIRLSPRDFDVGIWHVVIGDAEINLGRFDAAIEAYRRALVASKRDLFVYTNLAAAYAQSGNMDEAKAALAEARRLNPAITVKWMKGSATSPRSENCASAWLNSRWTSCEKTQRMRTERSCGAGWSGSSRTVRR